MVWRSDEKVYQETFTEGFLLLKGHTDLHMYLNDSEHGYVTIPTLQLMKVHKEHPIVLTYGGRISLRPKGDERYIVKIVEDENKKLHDGISILFCPPIYELNKAIQTSVIENGFRFASGAEDKLTIGYLSTKYKWIGDSDNITTIVKIPPPIIYHELLAYLRVSQRVYTYKKPFDKFTHLGNIDIDYKIIAQTVNGITKNLEERFETQLNTR